MDNITHTLSGALAARVVNAPADRENARRTLFWLLLIAANLPDIDIVARFVTDPIGALNAHRGITHSLVAAPLFALLPALLFYRFSKVKNLLLLWLSAWLGIAVHIFLDLVTPFGTQLFFPLSSQRFSLDWMFIVDPLFTVLMAAGLWAGRRWRTRRFVRYAAFVVLAAYLLLEAAAHQIAEARVGAYARGHGLSSGHISALPQPLSVFRWMGIVQTDEGLRQMFFTIFDDTLADTAFPAGRSQLVRQTRELPEARWYLSYARHPWVHEVPGADSTVVEFRDLQFSVDPSLARRFGLPERDFPFVLRYVYEPSGRLRTVRFDRDVIRRGPGT